MKVNRQLSFMKACDIGDSLIAIDEFGCGLFQINKSDMSSQLLKIIKNTENRRNLYQCAERFNNEIFFFPFDFLKDDIIVYHLQTRQIEYIDLKQINRKFDGEYQPVMRVDDSVWMFPIDLKKDAVRFSLETRKIEVITQWKSIVGSIVLGYTDSYQKVGEVKEIGSMLYQAVKQTNHILEINKEKYEIKCHTLQLDVKLHIEIGCDGKKLWLAEQDNKGIISWNPVTGDTCRYPMPFAENELNRKSWVAHIICGKKYLWLIPERDKKVIRMNYETGKYECINIFPQKFSLRRGKFGAAFRMIIKRNHVADLYPFTSNLVIHIDLENDVLLEQHEQIFLPEEWSDQDVINYQLQNDYAYEVERISPDVYMNAFCGRISQEEKKEQCHSNGKRIWEQICGE